MTTVIEATFDGTVFRPKEPVTLKPNTPVRLTVEALPVPPPATSFLRVARSLKIQGPPDWSENVDKYLHGEEPSSER
jgi:predicted DNA-binding antitoxin AbrB/MazE fold protein